MPAYEVAMAFAGSHRQIEVVMSRLAENASAAAFGRPAQSEGGPHGVILSAMALRELFGDHAPQSLDPSTDVRVAGGEPAYAIGHRGRQTTFVATFSADGDIADAMQSFLSGLCEKGQTLGAAEIVRCDVDDAVCVHAMSVAGDGVWNHFLEDVDRAGLPAMMAAWHEDEHDDAEEAGIAGELAIKAFLDEFGTGAAATA